MWTLSIGIFALDVYKRQPLKDVLFPRIAEPSICQNIFLACAPPVRITSPPCLLYTSIYVGAQSELGYFLPGQNGCHTYHSLVNLLPEDQRAFEDVWDIVIDKQDVFFRTNHVVFQYSGGKMIIHKPMGSLLSMFVTREGLCIQTIDFDLLVFKNGSFEPFLKVDGLQSAITGALAWDGDTVILSTLKQGLFYLANGSIGRWATLYLSLIHI